MNEIDKLNMAFALEISQNSHDASRKTGCVIIGRGGHHKSYGWNRFPIGVEETPERMARPAKYAFTEHAERYAIYMAARNGKALEGSTAYLTWYPCTDCARALVQVGISRLVCYEPDWSETQYGFREAKVILEEGGVDMIEYAGQYQETSKPEAPPHVAGYADGSLD